MAKPGSALSKIITPSLVTNLQAATLWGAAAGTTAIWLVQPFDWIKKTFFEKPTEQ